MAEISGGEKLETYLRETAKKLGRGASLKVGFLEDATYPDGTPVAMVAAIQNFGAPAVGIPPRPFFTMMVTEQSGSWPAKIGRLLERNGMDAQKTLNQFGMYLAAELQSYIVKLNAPRLSPVTIMVRALNKGNFPNKPTFAMVLKARELVADGAPTPSGTSVKPLIDTGYMYNSVGYKVDL